MMENKKYLIAVVVVLGLVVVFGVVNAKADRPVGEFFKRILKVMVVNEEPIEVSVVGGQVGGKVVTLFDNESFAPGEVKASAYINVDTYKTAVIFIKRLPVSKIMYMPVFSPNGVIDFPEWSYHKVLDSPTGMEVVDLIKAPMMRLEIYNHLSDSQSVSAYLYLRQ